MENIKKLNAQKNKVVKTEEKKLESKLKNEIEKLGGLALKFTSPYFTGMPDRVLLLPKGRLFFVELKSKNGKVSLRQAVVHKQLSLLGFRVAIIDDDFKLTEFLKGLDVS